MDNKEWRKKFQDVWETCHGEVKKTTDIGKRMFTASKTNSSLHESYEALGKLTRKCIDSGELKWESAEVEELLTKIKDCEINLKNIEEEMNKLKFASGPEDISKTPKHKD